MTALRRGKSNDTLLKGGKVHSLIPYRIYAKNTPDLNMTEISPMSL